MSEFQLRSFTFESDRPHNLVESQWPFISAKLFTGYRVTLSICLVIWVISDFATEWLNSYQGYPYYWLLLATNWSFTTLVVAHIMLAFISILTNCHHERSPFVVGYQACWFFYNISCNTVLTTSVVYMFALVNSEQEIFNTTQSKLKHGINAVVVIVDLLLSAITVRIYHGLYPLILGLIYTIMTAIYYAAGGKGLDDNGYIYQAFHWKYPGRGVVAVICVVIMSILVQLTLFVLVLSRKWLHKVIFGDELKPYDMGDQTPIIAEDKNSYSAID